MEAEDAGLEQALTPIGLRHGELIEVDRERRDRPPCSNRGWAGLGAALRRAALRHGARFYDCTAASALWSSGCGAGQKGSRRSSRGGDGAHELEGQVSVRTRTKLPPKTSSASRSL